MIRVPFKPRWRDAMLNGDKVCTTRTKPFGRTHDMFEVFGTTFRITYVSQIFLWLVAKQWYQDEGCKSPEEFEQVWKALHPRRGFDPNQKVWLHRFVRVYDGIMVEQYVKLKGGP